MLSALNASFASKIRRSVEATVQFDANFGSGERSLVTAILSEHYQRIFEAPMPERVDIPAQRWKFVKDTSGLFAGQTDDRRMAIKANSFRQLVERLRAHCRTPASWREPSTQIPMPTPRAATTFSLTQLFFSTLSPPSQQVSTDGRIKGIETRPQ